MTHNHVRGLNGIGVGVSNTQMGTALSGTASISIGNLLLGDNVVTGTLIGVGASHQTQSNENSSVAVGDMQVTNNMVRNVGAYGVGLGRVGLANDASTQAFSAAVVENNSVTNCSPPGAGLYAVNQLLNPQGSSAGLTSVTANTISHCGVGAAVLSILVDTSVAHNQLTGNMNGFRLQGFPGTVISVTHNSVTSATLSPGVGLAAQAEVYLTDITISNYATSIANSGNLTPTTNLAVDGDILQGVSGGGGPASLALAASEVQVSALDDAPAVRRHPDLSPRSPGATRLTTVHPAADSEPVAAVTAFASELDIMAMSVNSNFHAENKKLDIGGDLIVAGGNFYTPPPNIGFSLTGSFTHTGGTYYQTLPVNGSADVGFPKAGGLILNANGLDLGSTAVAITAGADCAGVPYGQAVQHCYVITPTNTTGRQATGAFYYNIADMPLGHTCSLVDVYLWDGTWDNLFAGDNRQCAANPLSVRATGLDAFGDFTLRSLFVTASKDDSVTNDLNSNGLPDVGDTVQYEIVVANVGDSDAVNVQFTDTPDANSLLQTGSVATTQGSVTSGNTGGDTTVTVDIGTISTSGSVTITFDVVVNRPDGIETITNQGTVSGDNFISLVTDDPSTATFGDATRSTAAYRYLPIILKNYTSAPDLIITDLVVNGGDITMTVKNQGNAAVTDPFWVDVYFNPTKVSALNEPWQKIAPAGAVWGFTDTIAMGDSMTLTVGDAYYRPDLSATSFPTGAQVYGYVDSVNLNTNYGNVWELDETNNLWPRPVADLATMAVASRQGQPGSSLPQR